MSGFLALATADPRPRERAAVQAMTATMAYRGPDGQGQVIRPHCALGFALLDTTDGRRPDPQPRSVGDDLWIVADARLDDRSALAAALGLGDGEAQVDSELILLAYRRWGDDCLSHLLGDFSFVIWDAARRRLLAARDLLGLRPFYYHRRADALLCSNTLHCLRHHRRVSDNLDDGAVADFLLFGVQQDLQGTVFADVHRLPPAHRMVWQPGQGEPRVERYGRLAPQTSAMPTGFEAAAEEYRSLLDEAVADRLTSDHGAIFLSGGMDSPAVAALAWRQLQGRPRGTRFEAFTAVYRRLIDDPEEPFARAVSDHLGMPHHLRPVDDDRFFEGWGQRFMSAEPTDGSMLPLNDDLYRRVASFSRIALTGDGADPALILSTDDLWRQLTGGRLDRVGMYLWQALKEGRRPPLGLRTAWLRWRQRRTWRDSFPTWLRREWVEAQQLEQRWRDVRFAAPPATTEERREALDSLVDPSWVAVFESEDPGSSGFLLERRLPFFDLRLLRFSLALPAPWCQGKRLLRHAVADILPAVVLERPKTPLAGVPRHDFAAPPRRLMDDLRVANPQLMEYLDFDAVYRDLDHFEGKTIRATTAHGGTQPEIESPSGIALDDVSMRVLSLSFWLARLATDGKGSDLCS